MSLFDFCITRKRSVIFLVVLLVLSGFYSYLKIPKEERPDVKIPLIYVHVSQRGISPEDARKMILQPLEIGLQGLEDVKRITGYAYDGAAVTMIEFLAGSDPDSSLNDVRNRVNDTKSKLPKDSDQPVIKQIDLSLMPVLSVVLSGDLSKRELLAIARNTRDLITKVTSVREVSISGSVDEAVQIIIKPEIMEKYRLSTAIINDIIASNNLLIPAGTIQKQDGAFAVKVPALIANYSELLDFPVSSVDGKVLRLKDIATIKRDFKDIDIATRVNGKNAVILDVSKRAGENLIETVSEVKALVEETKKQLPEGVEVTYAFDTSHKIMDVIYDLENGIVFAAILVLIIIIMAVGVKSAMLIALSLPVSFFICILIMDICGYTLNIVVLFSLILTVGMVVDDAIVVTEYADRKMIEGKSSEESYLEAAKRMFVPIFTATLVKIIVFLPFLAWPGVLGQFMKYIPITVLIIMTNSLVFALLIQPALGSIFMKKHTPVSEEEIKSIIAAETGPLSDIKGLTGKYIKLLQQLLRRPWRFIGAITGLMVLTIVIFVKFSVGVEFFPDIQPDAATLIVRSAGNLSLQEKSDIMREIEKRVFDFKDSVKIFYTKAGKFDNSHQFPMDTIGTILMELTDWKTRDKAIEIIEEIRNATHGISGVIIQTLVERKGPTSGKPIQMNITGVDYEKIMDFTKDLKRVMVSELDGFKDTNDSLPVPGIEWNLKVDKELAAKYFLSANDIGDVVQMATGGLKISTCRLDDLDYEVDILVRFPESTRLISKLADFRAVNRNGQVIPLNKFVTQFHKPSLQQIKRVDREDVFTIESDVKPGYLVDNQIKKIKQWLENNPKEGLKVAFKGEAEDQKETANFLRNAFLFILAMTFLIMLTQFNSFYDAGVVMSAVFLSITGVLLGLLITGRPFGIVMCGIGVMALAGIVLNNNILIVDTFHHLQKNGFDSMESIVRACAQRVRPILLTAGAAVLGLLPLAMKITLDFVNRSITYDAPSTQWWTQLATAICGGLTFATILTLFFTPSLLAIRYCKNYYKTKVK